MFSRALRCRDSLSDTALTSPVLWIARSIVFSDLEHAACQDWWRSTAMMPSWHNLLCEMLDSRWPGRSVDLRCSSQSFWNVKCAVSVHAYASFDRHTGPQAMLGVGVRS